MIKLATFFALAIVSKLACANMLTNGGFDADLSGWSITQPYSCVSYTAANMHDAPGGLQAMGCNPAATVSQTVSGLTVGGNYQLSYWLKNSYGSGSSTFSSTLGSDVLKSITLAALADWTQYTFDWTATSTSAALTFSLGQTRNSSAWLLDTVSLVASTPPVIVTDVSEPGTLLLAGLGAMAVGFACRPRRAAAQ